MNSIRHGLSSKMLVLPGEDITEYEDFTGGWFSSLGPETFAEAQIVALIADVSWRLERLRRVEHGHQLVVLEHLVAKTHEGIQFGLAERALHASGALVQVMSEMTSPPEELADLAGLVTAMGTVLGMVNEVEGLPLAVVDRLDKAIEAVSGSSDAKVKLNTLVEVTTAASAVKISLEVAMSKKKETLNTMKERIAAERLLLEDAELKKLARYQQLLENTLSHHLEQLKAIRERIKEIGKRDEDQLRELQVRLRVVR